MGTGRNFAQGYQLGKTMAEDFRGAMSKSEISDIASAKPEQSQGYTAADGNQLEAIANAKDPQGKPYYNLGADANVDNGLGSYTVTPNQAAQGFEGSTAAPATIAPGLVTDYLGNRTSGSLSDGQINSAKQSAIANVIMKSDPVKGAAMLRDVTKNEQSDKSFALSEARAERERKQAEQSDQYQQEINGINAKVAQQLDQSLTNPDGTKRQPTVDDALLATQNRAIAFLQAGRPDEYSKAMADYNAQSSAKIKLESSQRDGALGKSMAALGTGDFGPVKDFYNQYIPDGATVTAINRNAKGDVIIERQGNDGVKLPPTVMSIGQFTSGLASMKDPNAVYNFSQTEFKNNLALRKDAREGAKFGLDQSNARASMGDKQALRTANAAYYQASQDGDAAAMQRATLDVIKAGGSQPGASDKNSPSEVKLAQAFVNAGLAPDMRSGLEMAISRRGQSPDDIYRGFVSDGIKSMLPTEEAIKNADSVMTQMGYTKSGGSWRQNSGLASSDKPSPKPAEPSRASQFKVIR